MTEPRKQGAGTPGRSTPAFEVPDVDPVGTLQEYRVELAPTGEQRRRLDLHALLYRSVFNHGLARVVANRDQRTAERTYGIAERELTPDLLWTALTLERHWRRTHDAYPWFVAENLSSRVARAACLDLAHALSRWSASRVGTSRGPHLAFPHGLRPEDGIGFAMESDWARPVRAHAVRIPSIGRVTVEGDMSYLIGWIEAGRARVVGTRIDEAGGRWWIGFRVDLEPVDALIDERGEVDDLGIEAEDRGSISAANRAAARAAERRRSDRERRRERLATRRLDHGRAGALHSV